MAVPGAPGSLIGHGGDIDNRLKTLFDALQVPNEDQVTGLQPENGETRFRCLLEDDALIIRVGVETDRLLKPERAASHPDPTRVFLVLHVTLKATERTWANEELAD